MSETQLSTKEDQPNGINNGDNIFIEQSGSKQAIAYPFSRLGAMTRSHVLLQTLLDDNDPDNTSKVKKTYTRLKDKMNDFKKFCDEQLRRSDVSSEERNVLKSWKEEHLFPINEFCENVEDWLLGTSIHASTVNDDLNPEDSVSVANVRSAVNVRTPSITSSRRSQLAEKKIKLESKKKLLEKQAELEEKELEAKTRFDKEKLRIKKEAQLLKVELEKEELTNIEELDSTVTSEVSEAEHRQPIVSNKVISISEMLMKQANITEKLLETQAQASLPNCEPPIFDGSDVTRYRTFLIGFEQTIVKKCTRNSDKYFYLMRYTAGRANKLVESCNNMNADVAYESAIKLLNRNFGDENVISQHYLCKLRDWQPVKSDDVAALEEFVLYLTSCLNIMSNMDALNQLNSLHEIKELVLKLPYDMRKAFRSKVSKIMSNGETVNFEKFVKFVEQQLKMLKLPLFGDLKNSSKDTPKPKNVNRMVFNTTETPSGMVYEICLCCGKRNHTLDNCFFFDKKPMSAKEKFIKEKRLCFGCLKNTDHVSRNCPEKLVCKKCSKKHPSSLHRTSADNIAVSQQRQENSTFENEQAFLADDGASNNFETSMAVKGKNNFSRKVCCPAVPVRVINGNNSKVVYMALDSYSTGCYIDKALVEELNLVGKPANLSLTTMEGKSSSYNTEIINDIFVTSLDGSVSSNIPDAYVRARWPFDRKDSPCYSDLQDFPELKNLPFNFVDAKISILVGVNVPNLIQPLEIVTSSKFGTYASRQFLGWVYCGPVSGNKLGEINNFCLRTGIAELNDKIDRLFQYDFEPQEESLCKSFDDELWQSKVSQSISVSDNRKNFQIDLPFRDNDPMMPNNFKPVYHRFMRLTKQLKANEKFFSDYCKFMNLMFDNGFVESVPIDEPNPPEGKVWYLPHHGVYHKQKKKLRVVFDCSMSCLGTSLNDKLLKGPDLTNNLVGVLLRFRKGSVAVMGDVEKMFYMLHIPLKDKNFLRFFWYPNNDLSKSPIECRLNVHVFGAKSSGSCANFALRQCASESNSAVGYTILNSFYVDDMMASVDTEIQAIDLIKGVSNNLSARGFNLTGFMSNSRSVLATVPDSHLSGQLKNLDIVKDELPYERALGVLWNTDVDKFVYKINLPNEKRTKRGILSTIFSIYDPLFLASPVVLPAKKLFQEACYRKLDWDDELPNDLLKSWLAWLKSIELLKYFAVPRCFCDFSYVNCQLHLFSDASEVAFGSVGYLRCEDQNGKVQVSIVMAKVRLTPLNRAALKTVPRIELAAARLSVELYIKLNAELHIKFDNVYFWTDSKTVLNYISSDHGKFHRFVANRVAYIRGQTNVSQWKFVPGKLNPADLLSRGTNDVAKFNTNEIWLRGPDFLSNNISLWPDQPERFLDGGDCELKSLYTKVTSCDSLSKIIASTSSWLKLKYRVATLVKFCNFLAGKQTEKGISVEELLLAEMCIFKYVQRIEFESSYEKLGRAESLPVSNPLSKLCPFIDNHGVMRVGGRLANAQLAYDSKFPIILPKCVVSKRIVEYIHKKLGHLGRQYIIAEIRQRFHVINLTSIVKNVVRYCIICRKLHGKPCEQIMANLPSDRVASDLPVFASTGIDFFGPFLVSRGRGLVKEKRYGVILTCLASRAVHLEIAHSLDTSSFVNALRRFLARRGGPVKQIRCDNGTNLVAGSKELKDSINNINCSFVKDFCLEKSINWIFQPPGASHFGGAFERLIRTTRKILNSLLEEFHNQIKITDEVLLTLMAEVENILNCRPLTSLSSDCKDLEPLTPNHLLRFNGPELLPPTNFVENDSMSQKKWRQVQYLADVFWSRWRREYLPLLQERQKWLGVKRSLKVGDYVLVVDQCLPRNIWSTGVIHSVKINSDGFVRSATVKVSRCKHAGILKFGVTYLDRPITKLILLREVEDL